ncbi:hypothetical protein X732_11765 [Mesorhizobium sp. L2C066B000]|nr:hypothetical protein X732_11765 [Mesorhizobium sp. L2C066B000]
MNNQDNPSLAGLVTDLAQNVTTLVQTPLIVHKILAWSAMMGPRRSRSRTDE